nr:hypothetical protein [Candidatus Njordarchaeota archaeon]
MQMLIPLSIIGIDDMMLFLIVIVVVAIGVGVFAAKRLRGHKPSVAAPTVAPTAPTPPRVEKVTEVPSEKVDEDMVRLRVEKTATESALKSLESAMKEGAIAKETFEKYKATYYERLRKIDTELSRRTRGPVGIPKLESDIDKVRKSYLEKLKELSRKAISVRPLEAGIAKPTVQPSREVPVPVVKPPTRLPEVPSAPTEEVTEKPLPPLTPPARHVPPEAIPQQPVSATAGATPVSPTTIADLRREMMDELNRLKRLIGHAGS